MAGEHLAPADEEALRQHYGLTGGGVTGGGVGVSDADRTRPAVPVPEAVPDRPTRRTRRSRPTPTGR